MTEVFRKRRKSTVCGEGWEMAICTGYYAQLQDVAFMQTVELDVTTQCYRLKNVSGKTNY